MPPPPDSTTTDSLSSFLTDSFHAAEQEEARRRQQLELAGVLKPENEERQHYHDDIFGRTRTKTTTTTTTEKTTEVKEEEEMDGSKGLSVGSITAIVLTALFILALLLCFAVAGMTDYLTFCGRCFQRTHELRAGGNCSMSYRELAAEAAEAQAAERRREQQQREGDIELFPISEEEEETASEARKQKGKGKKSAVGGEGGGVQPSPIEVEGSERDVPNQLSSLAPITPGGGSSSSSDNSIIITTTTPVLHTPGGKPLLATSSQRVPLPTITTTKPPFLRVKVAGVRDDVPSREGFINTEATDDEGRKLVIPKFVGNSTFFI